MLSNPEAQTPQKPLELYGRDLTEAARAGKLDPVIGRDEEIRRTVQILSRRTKNNPVLIGEPGFSEKPPPGNPGHGLADRRCQVPRRV